MAVPAPPGGATPDVYRTVVDVLDYGVLLVDGEGTVLAGNPSAERILGFSADRVCGGANVPWVFVSESGSPVLAADLPCQRSLRSGVTETATLGVRRSDGTFAWVEFVARPTRNGEKPVSVLSFTDVTARRAEEHRLAELAARDTLTGLFNRRHFEESLRQHLTRGGSGMLLLVDLDGLKTVNDSAGHATGDELLREAAARLEAELRSGDLLARWGGDEFAILMPEVDRARGEDVAARLTLALAERRADRPTPVASVGVAAVEEGIAQADASLYATKRATRPAPPRGAQALERLGADLEGASVERMVAAAREMLDMDLAYAARITATDQIFEVTVGDAASFGVSVGGSMPVEETYCHRILAGELPHVMADVNAHPAAAKLAVTAAARVGAYVSVPIRFRSGELHGTLCCAAHETREDVGERDVRLLQLLGRMIADHIEHERMISERAVSTGLRALAAAVEARDHYTSEHSEIVLELVAATARRMGLDDEQIAVAEQVALLHDIGKLAIPDAILHKPGPLTEDEWVVMRTHPDAGARLVGGVPELAHLAPAIAAEHERWDGGGYPAGLRGSAIPVASRIAFVCDAYSAMTSDRPYRQALSRDVALGEIAEHAGSQFCPVAAAALVAQLSQAA